MMLPAIDKTLPLGELLSGFATPDAADRMIKDVVLDSRSAVPGALFLACAGEGGHGLSHASHAIAGGAVAIAWEPAPGHETPPELAVPTIAIPELGRRAGRIAARFYGQPAESLFTVGVTGTDGKTSCAWLIARALAGAGQRCGYLGTLGFGEPDDLALATHTTPDAARIQHWLARMQAAGDRAAALEVSSHALAQHRTDAVAFDVAVLTQIGRDHLDYHGSDKAYVAAKRRLFDAAGLQFVVLNADDAHGAAWLDEFADREDVRPIAYGESASVGGQALYVRIADVTAHDAGLTVMLVTHAGTATLDTGLIGRFNAHNLAACLAVLLARGIALDVATLALGEIQSVPGRMERIPAAGGQAPLVIVDYAHTAGALKAALAGARAHASNRLFCVFGCGGDRDRGKRALMGAAAAVSADRLWLTDDNPRSEDPAAIVAEIIAGLPAEWQPGTHYDVVHRRAEAIAAAVSAAGPGDVVLVAGKGHETTQRYGSHIYEFDDRVAARRALEAA